MQWYLSLYRHDFHCGRVFCAAALAVPRQDLNVGLSDEAIPLKYKVSPSGQPFLAQ